DYYCLFYMGRGIYVF
nr:immunoglobulin light chain junction region [Macaca mulatta]MOW02474.1 immunoglobulin light chain junction region [Macaca mulatta]MOW02703.1 immunoglobulin light chain junction region [Macaca mulatta]